MNNSQRSDCARANAEIEVGRQCGRGQARPEVKAERPAVDTHKWATRRGLDAHELPR